MKKLGDLDKAIEQSLALAEAQSAQRPENQNLIGLPDTWESCWATIKTLKTWNEANNRYEAFPQDYYLRDIVKHAYTTRERGGQFLIEKSRRLVVSYLWCAIEWYWLMMERRNHLLCHLTDPKAKGELWRIWQLHESYRETHPYVPPIEFHGNVASKQLDRLMIPNGGLVEKHHADAGNLRGSGVTHVRLEELPDYRYPAEMYGQALILVQGKAGEPGGTTVCVGNAGPSKDWAELTEGLEPRTCLGIDGYTAKNPYRLIPLSGDKVYMPIFFTASVGKDARWAENALKAVPPHIRDREYLLMRDVYDGRPVFPTYSDVKHWPESVRGGEIPYMGGAVVVALDCGAQTIHFGASIWQITKQGQVVLSRELAPEDVTNATEFFPSLLALVREFAPTASVIWGGDETMRNRSGLLGMSMAQYLSVEFGIHVKLVPNALHVRLTAVDRLLGEDVDGYPRFVLDGYSCPVIREGFLGAYRWRERTLPSGGVQHGEPVKDDVSHVMDSVQYGAIMVGSLLKTWRIDGHSARQGNDGTKADRVLTLDAIEAARLGGRSSLSGRRRRR